MRFLSTPALDVEAPRALWIREVVFGVNDGLVSISGMVVGVTASRMGDHAVVISALAAAAAAVVAMGLGQYLATTSENEYVDAAWAREAREVDEVPHLEQREVEVIMEGMGFPADEAAQFTRRLMQSKVHWVNFMMREELGLSTERSNPWYAATVMAAAVAVGSLPPIVPYFVWSPPSRAVPWAIAFAMLTAFTLGVAKARVTLGSPWRSGIRFVVVAVGALVMGVVAGHLLGML